jgi:hypothetical protein
MHPRKRWMTLCAPVAGGWQVQAPEPVGDPGTLFARLRARAGGLPVAFGIDCPIGVPRGYAALCGGGYADFPAFLRGLADRPAFFRVAAGLGEVSAEAPFYPARGVRGMTRLAHARALGLADAAALNRACDRATADRPAGAPVFWTLGANQSGKAALAAWRDVLIPGLAAGAVRLWPFEGAFLGLLAPGEVAVAETYPAEAMRHLGLRVTGSKRRQGDRAAYAAGIVAAMAALGAAASEGLRAALADGFGGGEDGEDRFDSVLGVLCVLGVLTGRRGDAAPADAWVRAWEGWVLGQDGSSVGKA